MVRFKHGISKFIKHDPAGMAASFAQTSGMLLSGGMETWKLIAVLLLIMFSLNGDILSADREWLTKNGYPYSTKTKFTSAHPKLSVCEMVVSCCAAVLELHWFLTFKYKSEPQLETLEYLIANARAHYLILYQLKFRLQHMIPPEDEDDSSCAGAEASKGKRNRQTATEGPAAVITESKCQAMKHHFMTHYPEQARNTGGDFSIVDTEPTEHAHIYLVGNNYSRIAKHQEHTSHDMIKRVLKDRMLSYNADMNGGLAQRKTTALSKQEGVDDATDPMVYVVPSNASSQYLEYDGSSCRWSIRRHGSDTHASSVAFVHPRLSEEQMCDFLSSYEQRSKLPTAQLRCIRLVTQCRCEGNGLSPGVPPFYIHAKPANLFKQRRDVEGHWNIDEYSFVLVEYSDSEGLVKQEVAMVLGIINYQEDVVSDDADAGIIEETLFLIAWMQDSNMASPFPYPVKAMVVLRVGEGGATRTGSRLFLDLVSSRHVVEGAFVIKACVTKQDKSLANLGNVSWGSHESARYYYVSLKRQTPSYDYVLDDYVGTFPGRLAVGRCLSPFMSNGHMEWVFDSLSHPLPPNTRKRWSAVRRTRKQVRRNADDDDEADLVDEDGGDDGDDNDDDDVDDDVDVGDRALAPRGGTLAARLRR